MMKKIIFLCLICVFCSSCSFFKKSPDLEVCEGLDYQGLPVNCGDHFTTGTLNVVIPVKKLSAAESFTCDLLYGSDEKNIQSVKAFRPENGDYLSIPISFALSGNYKIQISDKSGILFEKNVRVE